MWLRCLSRPRLGGRPTASRVAGLRKSSKASILDPAIRRVEKQVKEHMFCTHGNPIANWRFSNVSLGHGVRQVRLDKKTSREKIDAAAAACFAMDVFLKTPPKNRRIPT